MGANDFRSVKSFVEPLDWRGWPIPLALCLFLAEFFAFLAFGVAATVRDILDD